ncbi:MAG: SnoaL-like domain-containing protein [Acidobacteriota bacterium]
MSDVNQNVADLDRELNQTVLSGDIMGAFERFYADDVVMIEPGHPPHEGKAVNREREQQFVDSVGEFHGAEVLASGVAGDGVTFSEWVLDITFKGGPRKKLEQVAVRRWRGSQVVSERFYYDPS